MIVNIPADDLLTDHFEYIAAVLVDRFRYTPAEILSLDRDWIYSVCFHRRDEKGAVMLPPPPQRQTAWDNHVRRWAKWGVVDRDLLRRFFREDAARPTVYL